MCDWWQSHLGALHPSVMLHHAALFSLLALSSSWTPAAPRLQMSLVWKTGPDQRFRLTSTTNAAQVQTLQPCQLLHQFANISWDQPKAANRLLVPQLQVELLSRTYYTKGLQTGQISPAEFPQPWSAERHLSDLGRERSSWRRAVLPSIWHGEPVLEISSGLLVAENLKWPLSIRWVLDSHLWSVYHCQAFLSGTGGLTAGNFHSLP